MHFAVKSRVQGLDESFGKQGAHAKIAAGHGVEQHDHHCAHDLGFGQRPVRHIVGEQQPLVEFRYALRLQRHASFGPHAGGHAVDGNAGLHCVVYHGTGSRHARKGIWGYRNGGMFACHANDISG